MAEYIERSKIVYPYMHEELWWGFNKSTSRVFNEGVKATEDAIAAIPAADVVEVPCHCKDCRYNDPSWQMSADSIGCRYWGIYPDPDDWCCKAEMKGGE